MKIRNKQVLINLVMAIGLISALALSLSLVNRLNKIHRERQVLNELELSIRSTLTEGAWLLQRENRDESWSNFEGAIRILESSFIKIESLESITRLNDTIQNSLNAIQQLRLLEGEQYSSLSAARDKMLDQLTVIPNEYIEGRSFNEIVSSNEGIDESIQAYIKYTLKNFNQEYEVFEATLLAIINKLDDHILVIEDQLNREKERMFIQFSLIIITILLVTFYVSHRFAIGLTRAIEGITASLFNKINNRQENSETIARDDELGYLSENINVIFEQLISVKNNLEERVLDRTRDLELEMAQRRKTEEDLRITLNSIGDAVIALDLKKRITQMNPVAVTLSEYSRDEALGIPINNILNFRSIDKGEPFNFSLIENISEKNQSFIMETKSGKEYIILVSVTSILTDQDEVVGSVMVLKNMTSEYKLRQQVEQNQKMDTLGQLAGGIAHDFNNVLGGIMGAADLLNKRLTGKGDEKTLVNMILETTEKATELTGQLLSFSRKQINKAEPVDLHEIITASVKLLERTVDKKIEIKTDTRALQSIIEGYNFILQNMIINLGINAGHAMSEGGTLYISTRNITIDEPYCKKGAIDLVPGPYISLTIEDTGSGIPPDILPHIFEPFFTTKDQGKGTGLGLASVYASVIQHNGEIKVYSETGEGTSFVISLPLTKDQQRIIQERDEKPHRGSGTVLIIEDEDSIRFSIGQMLKSMEYEVLSAPDGKKGVETFVNDKEKIRLVILDMIMPVMNGLDCLREIRDADADIPVILISGFAQPRHLMEIEELGIAGRLTKPFRFSDFNSLLNRIMD